MYGAIIGDIIGSVYEFNNDRRKDISINDPEMRFTDDTVLTVATMDSILNPALSYSKAYKEYYRRYKDSHRGFGDRFRVWGHSDTLEPYNSFGNGSAMRVSPVAWIYETEEEVLSEAKRSAEVTHNHPEGIKGAQAIALAIYLARKKVSKLEIEIIIEDRFEYNLVRSIEEIRMTNRFDETCQGSVPEALICFFKSSNFEDSIRTAISIGGDSDTIACMTGSIAEAYYGMDQKWIDFADDHLDNQLREVVKNFYERYNLLPIKTI